LEKGCIIIIMGVSGCGKSTVGETLSKKTKIPFFDADDFHSKTNITKMNSGISLNDSDRYPWLRLLADKIETWSLSRGAILACSALKEEYRAILASKHKNIFWVFLWGEKNLIGSRIAQRKEHFMSPTLIDSQFKDLEVPKYGLHINISKTVEEIAEEIINKIEQK